MEQELLKMIETYIPNTEEHLLNWCVLHTLHLAMLRELEIDDLSTNQLRSILRASNELGNRKLDLYLASIEPLER